MTTVAFTFDAIGFTGVTFFFFHFDLFLNLTFKMNSKSVLIEILFSIIFLFVHLYVL